MDLRNSNGIELRSFTTVWKLFSKRGWPLKKIRTGNYMACRAITD